jgi:hypothetical protein
MRKATLNTSKVNLAMYAFGHYIESKSKEDYEDSICSISKLEQEEIQPPTKSDIVKKLTSIVMTYRVFSK